MGKNKAVLPPQTIGIIGGGQLGRMMAFAAREMGYRIVVLDPTPNCPTAQVADEQIVAPYDDENGIQRLTELSDVVTYEFENVDLEMASFIEKQGKLPQGAFPLEITQNREKEKRLLEELRLPIPMFAIVHNGEELEKALADFSYPVVVKTCRGGYDGKGQLKLDSEDDIPAVKQFVDEAEHCIVEEWIPFEKEVSVVFTRSQAGEITFFPLAENIHKDHILFQTIAPARVSTDVQKKAYEAARLIAEKIGVVGTFAVEMFVKEGDIFINEMAPRPHNSGHYTIEACNVSQFKQHIRAICQLPLMEIDMVKPAVMQNILGEDMPFVLEKMIHEKDGIVHLYGKEEIKEKRKMGHITIVGTSLEKIMEQADSWRRQDYD